MTKRIAFLPLIAVLAGPAQANDPITAAEGLIAASIAEWRVFVTCTSLTDFSDPATMVRFWHQMVGRTLPLLAPHPDTATQAATLNATLAPGAMMAPDDTPFGQVRAMCLTDNPGWSARLREFRFIQLDREVATLF